MKITSKLLREKGACEKARKMFARKYPHGVKVTEAACLAQADEWDWGWAASQLLSASAFAEFDRATAPALSKYNRAIAPALAEYERAIAPAFAEFDRATAPAWAEYNRAKAPFLAEYNRARASAFGRLAEKSENP